MPLTRVALLLLAVSAGAAGELNRYALILSDAPLAADARSRKDLRRASGRAVSLAARQSALRAALVQRNIDIIAADPLLTNAVFVRASGAEQLKRLPGVAFVEQLRPLRRHLDTALDLSNVPPAWSVVGGAEQAGAGVRIGVIDSGIDSSHPAFSDAGLEYPAGFPKCDRDPSDCAYANRKVIVARSYVDMLVSSDPAESRPDDLSPRDRVGHGTAVAMIAAGRANTGPLGTIQGVAPAAFLGNYKVFGSPGVNGDYTYDDVLFQALSDALVDEMDVVIVALGAPAVWGPRDAGAVCDSDATRACDWRAEAIEQAARLGLTVVVSAGDSGQRATRLPAYNSIETPGTAPAAITVGAMTNARRLYQSLTVEGPDVPEPLRRLNTSFGDGPRPDAPITAAARAVANGCEPLAGDALQGVFAIVPLGDCQPLSIVQNAQRAGALGVVFYPDTPRLKGLEESGISAVSIDDTDAAALKAFIASAPDARITLDPSFHSVAGNSDEVAAFSSRGPSIRENGIKPELLAIGTDLYTATQRFDPNGDLYHASGYTAVDGTSFAAPLVAGTVALVKQRNPSFTPAQLKSAVVNTANSHISAGGQPASIFDKGAGKLDAGSAVRTNLTIEPATLTFGTSSSHAIRICNHNSGPLNLRLASGSDRVVLNPTSVSLNANTCTENVTAALEGSVTSPGVYEGAIQVEGGAVPLRVPWSYVVPDGVPSSILLLEGDGFMSNPDRVVPLTFKVVDRLGIPVPNQVVRFEVVRGGGSIRQQSTITDDLGIGWADVVVGRQLGEQRYAVTVGPELRAFFRGRARAIPTISAGGVVNAASGQSGNGFAPGSYVSIFGRGLSEVNRTFTTPYLPISLAGVSVSFDAIAENLHLPGRIHFVSEGQLNVQIPWELQGITTARLKVSLGNASSGVISLPIARQSPALFEYTDATGRLLAAAVNETGVVGPGNSARRSGTISLYANGLGAVDNTPGSGSVASTSPLAFTRSAPVVTVGGRPAEILFSGLAPGFVGLYQLNIRLPADAQPGLQDIVVAIGGVQSRPAHLPVE